MGTRLHAFLIHLACSGLVATLAMAVIFPLWHPGAIARLQGVDRLVLVLIGVDVVLGPVMTLVIFNPRKARHLLRMDLSIIAALQLTALAYGMHAIFIARPVFVVFNIDRFDIVTAQEVDRASLQRASAGDFGRLPLSGPRIVAARLPSDPGERTQLMFSALEGGPDLYQLPEHYVAYAQERAAVIKRAQPLEKLRNSNDFNDDGWRDFLNELPVAPDEGAFLPVVGKAREGVAIVQRDSGQLLQLLLLNPSWDD